MAETGSEAASSYEVENGLTAFRRWGRKQPSGGIIAEREEADYDLQ